MLAERDSDTMSSDVLILGLQATTYYKLSASLGNCEQKPNEILAVSIYCSLIFSRAFRTLRGAT